ncbi:MAG TPA: ribosome small subunit-dependent GTPase A [Fervidobacterium sp.]|nr:ribosome small subunit-dependent GTPase A [Fervidobacterium sp.]HPT53670.1 ribosome small subunit-dependent GTPase A [Fervidobacterium sp.]HPZ17489.1 ribosome small subunit-dependent GTPase A [Fervidobacterium sp.]HQE48579.1 ribosome small subunit-dependent GTPase A [Fervidobacterium sp.]HUM42355.1 ribosome small subunit-dependent GTPase A [Fervidobacterium sp.]
MSFSLNNKSSRRKGVVSKFYSNLLVVEDIETGKQYLCKLRGKFKKQRIRPITGDIVEYEPIVGNEGVVENIINRKNQLNKPSVANVDQVIIVTALEKPRVPYEIVDRFVLLVEKEGLPIIIVLNKVDLLAEEQIIEFEKIYGRLYPVLKTSAKTGVGIDELKSHLCRKVSVFAGMSGVGKSSLLNTIDENLKLRTGEISERLGRGKHTTTTAELLRIASGGWVVDTPGFASLEMAGIQSQELREFFVEFENEKCHFSDCSHVDEPGCYVREMIEKNKISRSRYESYLKFLRELKEKEDSNLPR